MNRDPGETLTGIAVTFGGVLLLCAGVVLAVCHCGSSTPTAAQTAQVGALALELDGCVATSATEAQYETCRNGVLAAAGVDGGPFVRADAASEGVLIVTVRVVDAGGDQ